MTIVRDIEPAPGLRIAIEGDYVIANDVIMIPHRHALPVVDSWRRASLLAEVEAFFIANQQISLNKAVRRAGNTNARTGAPCAGSIGHTVAHDDIVMGVQAVGDFVKDAGVFIESNQAVTHGAVFIADIEPYTVSPVLDEGAVFEHHAAGQTYLVTARLPAAIESFDVVVSHRASGH